MFELLQLNTKGKPINSWRRDAFENGNSSTFLQQDVENGDYSPRRDAAVGGRAFPRKEFYGGPGFMSARTYYKTEILEPHMDEFSHARGQRWNLSGDGDNYGRNVEMESDFHENLSERYPDVGWAQGRYHGNPYPSYNDRLYQNPEADGVSSFGRCENEHPDPSTYHENEMEYSRAERSESTRHTGFESSHQGIRGQPVDVDAPLQSGIVRVFEQPGIEAPSDEDDFIEVRSKKQMLNDRREQREKEIKAKSRVTKMPRKPQPTSQSTFVSAISNIASGFRFDSKNNVQTSMGSWGNSRLNQQVCDAIGVYLTCVRM
ncbi:hypothetical protein QYF36_016656 [Acer negundo]|nr:hypothetical protein QYF36_016656 [Acer negundo]